MQNRSAVVGEEVDVLLGGCGRNIAFNDCDVNAFWRYDRSRGVWQRRIHKPFRVVICWNWGGASKDTEIEVVLSTLRDIWCARWGGWKIGELKLFGDRMRDVDIWGLTRL